MQEETLQYVPQYIREALARLGADTVVSIGEETFPAPRHLLPNELEWRTAVLTWCIERILYAISVSRTPETSIDTASQEVRRLAGLSEHELTAVIEIVRQRFAAVVRTQSNAQSDEHLVGRLRALTNIHYQDAWQALTLRYREMLTQESYPYSHSANC